MNKKHVAIFSLAYFPFVGGAEVAIKDITDRISKANFVFTCFTCRFDSRWPREEILGPVKVIRPNQSFVTSGNEKDYYGHYWKKLFSIFNLWRVAEKEHRRRPFSVIWAMMASYAGMAALLFKLRHPSVPFLLTLQEGDTESHILRRVSIFYPLWRLIFKKADRIQVISNYLEDFARRHGAKCPIEVVPNGVDLDRIKNFESRIKRSNGKTIITTSRLVNKNGVDILIRAFAELSKNLKPKTYHLAIVGDGPDREKLIFLAKKLGIADKVEFIGAVSPEKIPAYLAEADIFVRASRSEGLGNSFLEAMAAGLPVVGTSVGGIPDFLKDNETGLFCRVDDPLDLAKQIERLLSDEDLSARMSNNGRKLVADRYSWDGIAKKMEKIFYEIRPR